MSFVVKNPEGGTQRVIAEKGCFRVYEFQRDPSVDQYSAQAEYFMSKMNVRKKQVYISMNGANNIITQTGALQWCTGNIEATTGLKGPTDLIKKVVRGAVTNESAVKPEYRGVGTLVLEPTYKHILLIDVEDWGSKGISIEDGMFLASEASIHHNIVPRTNVSSALLGNEGLFNLGLSGKGIVALESFVPAEELIEVNLDNDVLKVDGKMAVCWSSSLAFTVERSSKKLIGSAVTGEGFLNVYRGTGKVLLCPTSPTIPLLNSNPLNV